MLGLRSDTSSYSNTWSFWGGKQEKGEINGDTLSREVQEELGNISGVINSYAFDHYVSKDKKFVYASYITIVDNEFVPELNEEHLGYAWVDIGRWPKPLHNGARIILENKNNLKKLKQLVELHSNNC